MPARVAIVEELTRRIDSGEWPQGHKLPTTIALAVQFNVSRTTVEQALAILYDRGLIVGHQGKGRWVADRTVSPQDN